MELTKAEWEVAHAILSKELHKFYIVTTVEQRERMNALERVVGKLMEIKPESD